MSNTELVHTSNKVQIVLDTLGTTMANVTMKQLRQMLKSAAQRISQHQTRISVEQLLQICQDSSPAHNCTHTIWVLLLQTNIKSTQTYIVPTGGVLLEAYIEGFCCYQTNENMKTVRSQVNSEGKADQDLLHSIVNREAPFFYGWVMRACGRIQTKARRQLFYLSFVARYHGLSVGGQDMLAKYGGMVKRATYDKLMDEEEGGARKDCR